jgi:hypothetical protein
VSISLHKIEKIIEPTKSRGDTVSLFFGTIVGIDGSTLVIETKSGGLIYAVSYVYCAIGDLVACLAFGTTIVAFAAKDAQRVADDLNKIGLIYTAGVGITIDETNKINADVTESDIQQLSTQISGKANSSHNHTAADTTSGVFSIDRIPTIPTSKLSGTIPNELLPSYVDDVTEGTLSTFPSTGETGKIYVDTTTNKTYRWSGSQYIEVSKSLALGETSSSAYRGDRGKIAYDHTARTDNPHNVTPSQIGAAEEDHTHSVNDLNDMPSWSKAATKPTYTYSEVGAAAANHEHEIDDVNGLQTALNDKASSNHTHSISNISGLQDALDSKAATSHVHTNATTENAGFLPKLGGGTANYLRADGTWAKPPNTTYAVMKAASSSTAGSAGLVPAPAAGKQASFLRGDGTWVVPTNTTYSNMKGASSSAAGSAGLVPAPAAGAATRYLCSDGTWKVPPDTKYSLSSFGITANSEELNKLDGMTASKQELNYLDGTTSNVQNQLNGKAALNHTHAYTVNGKSTSNPSWYAPSSAGTAGQYLVSSGSGAPTWETIQGGVVFMPNGYPEGSVYLTYDPDFNPADEFGGTWTKEERTHLFLGITIWRCVATPNKYFSPLDMYPVGTAFLTYDKEHNPAAEFGGTWTLEERTYLFMGIKIYRRIA